MNQTQLNEIVNRVVTEVLEASKPPASSSVSDSAKGSNPTDEELVTGFNGLFGLSESGAKIAVEGRI